MKKVFVILSLVMLVMGVKASVTKTLSPNGRLELQVTVEKGVSAKLFSKNTEVFAVENILLDTDKGIIPEENPKIRKVLRNSVNNIVKPVIKEKYAEIPEQIGRAHV